MLIKLVEIEIGDGYVGGSPSLQEVYLNPQHIISVSDCSMTDKHLLNEAQRLGLVENASFSKVVVQQGSRSRSLVVVGSPHEIHKKINKRQILRG
tara:strand:- start:1295 stop:1579 length:285 start_codon:yes stop_codon:yes gene_type:complete